MPISSRTGWDLLRTACAAGLISLLWIAAVPPFEGLDELYFYNRAVQFAAEPAGPEPLFYRLTSAVLNMRARPDGPVEPRYNPAFEFVGNERGTVTRFEHERNVAPRGHVRALYALRVLVAALGVLTALSIYGIVSLTLGRSDAALAVALVCIAIPQFSFMNAVVHGEAMTRLFGAAAALVVVAGVVGRIRRPQMWVALVALLAATPLIDRQGFFVIALAGAGAVMAEPTWRRRLLMLAVLAVPAVAMARFVALYNENGNLGPWFQLLRHPLRPLLYADPVSGATDPPGAPYYVFEFVPKLFISFWGWLGQPSILMPPAIYGALAAITIAGTSGAAVVLVSGRSRLFVSHPERLTALRVLAIGVFAMCVPIAYGPALAGRNLWYGRWLFPMAGPIVMLIGIGWAAILETPARQRRAAVALALAGAVAAVLWVTAPGAAFRVALETNHYGDRPHLIRVARDTIAALLMAAAGLEMAARWSRVAEVARSVRIAAASAVAVNVFVLTAVVWPLYRPLGAGDYVTLIRREIVDGQMNRAAEVYASAAKTYPDSQALRSLGDEFPRLLISGRLDEMSGLLEQQLARGVKLRDRETLLALAHSLRTAVPARSDAIEQAVATARREPDLAEPAELVRLALDRGGRDPSAADRPIEAGGGRSLRTPMRGGEAMLEGATAHRLPNGRVQVIVYFRPRVDWTSRRLWLHAYPDAAPQAYLDPAPMMTASAMPTPGELEWTVFELPPGRYQGYVGMWVGTNVGGASAIGPLP